MERRAIIISNPGELGADNYCEGVHKDVENFKAFLNSPIGGFWDDNEIVHLGRPNATAVKEAISKTRNLEYSFIAFCGHGYYSRSLDSTILELKNGQELDSIELRRGSPKQTIILDCCRKIFPSLVLEERMFKAAIAKSERINPYDCKRYFNQRIQECSTGKIIIHSCAINEEAGDDSNRGGYYSYNLIREGNLWAENQTVDTSKNYRVQTIVSAHEEAKYRVARLSDERQNPQIEKPRTDKYFPFTIVA